MRNRFLKIVFLKIAFLKIVFLKIALSFFVVVLILWPFSNSLADDLAQKQQAIKDAINQKAAELQNISDQIKESQKSLEETQNQKRTLQRDIKSLDSNINQVNLSINVSQVTIEKLGLEIESLNYFIDDTENKIANQETTVRDIIRELQQREGETPLIIFLKNKSLAASVFEAQSLTDLNRGLSVEIQKLKNAKDQLSDKLDNKSTKKQQVENENSNLKNKKIILADTKQAKMTFLGSTKNKEQVYQKQLNDLEKKQIDIAAEIEKLDSQLRAEINPSLLPTKRPGVLAMPVIGLVSQDYGATNFARFGYRGRWHNGIDIASPIGTPVFAAEKGTVIGVANQDRYCYRGAYGKFIAIRHENNLTTLYAHLSLQVVNVGDIVQRGQLIGYVGRTGYATGSHLHFAVYASQTFRLGPSRICGSDMPYGGDLNPLGYL